MIKYPVFIVAILISSGGYAQNSFNKNDIYLELLGNGIGASVNYERQLFDKAGLGIRVGLGYFSGDEQLRISIPVGMMYLFHLQNNSFIESGIGGTWSPASGLKTPKQELLAGGREYKERIWSFVPSIGYRRHTKGNFMYRFSFTPIINKYRLMGWVGLSIGKRF